MQTVQNLKSPFSTTQQKLQEVDAGIPMVDGG